MSTPHPRTERLAKKLATTWAVNSLIRRHRAQAEQARMERDAKKQKPTPQTERTNAVA